jgi:hypothetical protein
MRRLRYIARKMETLNIIPIMVCGLKIAGLEEGFC